MDVIYSDAEYSARGVVGGTYQEFNLLSLIRMNFIDACALYRKKLWEEVGGYDEHMPLIGMGGLGFLAASGCPWRWLLSIFRKIGFDYRVRSGFSDRADNRV